MRINIDLDTKDSADLIVLTALVAALGGRRPEVAVAIKPTPDSASVVTSITTETDDSDDQPVEPASADERDATGLPWDERIHAATRARNADGSWRQRRGVDAETVKRISESLKLGEAARTQPDPIPGMPPAPPAPSSDGPTPPAPTVSAPPVAPVAEVAPPPPATDNPFAAFQALNRRVGAAGLVYDDLNEIAKQAGFAAYNEVAKGGPQAVATFTLMAEALGKLTPES